MCGDASGRGTCLGEASKEEGLSPSPYPQYPSMQTTTDSRITMSARRQGAPARVTGAGTNYTRRSRSASGLGSKKAR